MPLVDTNIHEIIRRIDLDSFRDHPNILIAANLWEEERFKAALKCYKFMRMADDMIDDRKALSEALSYMEKEIYSNKISDWLDCLKGLSNGDPFIADVAEILDRYQIPLNYFTRFSRSMMYDINHDSFETFEDFLDYAEGASNMPASIFVHLCALRNIDGAYVLPEIDIIEISRPCAIFSYLVHIIRDFEKDQKNNLNYFAIDILEKHNLRPSELKQMAENAEFTGDFRNMIAEYVSITDEYRKATEATLERIAPFFEPRYLFSLKVIFNLYLQIFERIDVEKGSFTINELVPNHSEIKERVQMVAARELN
jgi:phytoene synthase